MNENEGTSRIEELVEIARDSEPNWITSLACLDDDFFVCGESSYNLFALRRRADCADDAERRRLECVGAYHLGEQVNVMCQGRLSNYFYTHIYFKCTSIFMAFFKM